MLDALIALGVAYLGLVYAFGVYLAARALVGRRLRQLVAGHPPRRPNVRPLTAARRAPEPTPPAPAQALERPRVAA